MSSGGGIGPRDRCCAILAGSAIALAVASCDGGPTAPVSFDGDYYLLRVDGQTVPVIVAEFDVTQHNGTVRYVVRITDGLLEVLSDSGVHWREDFHVTVIDQTGTSTVTSWGTRGKYGTYRRDGARIVFRFPVARPDGSFGTHEDTATLTAGGVSWRRPPLGGSEVSPREFAWEYVRP